MCVHWAQIEFKCEIISFAVIVKVLLLFCVGTSVYMPLVMYYSPIVLLHNNDNFTYNKSLHHGQSEFHLDNWLSLWRGAVCFAADNSLRSGCPSGCITRHCIARTVEGAHTQQDCSKVEQRWTEISRSGHFLFYLLSCSISRCCRSRILWIAVVR